MSELYPFTEWPDTQLSLRFNELVALAPIHHGPERAQQLTREINHLLFEMTQREPAHNDARHATRGTWRFPVS